MNSLPDVALFRILHALPGEDVSIFRRLNSRFNRIITKHRKSLQKPWNTLEIGIKWPTRNELNKVRLSFRILKEKCKRVLKVLLVINQKTQSSNFTKLEMKVAFCRRMAVLKRKSVVNFDNSQWGSNLRLEVPKARFLPPASLSTKTRLPQALMTC